MTPERIAEAQARLDALVTEGALYGTEGGLYGYTGTEVKGDCLGYDSVLAFLGHGFVDLRDALAALRRVYALQPGEVYTWSDGTERRLIDPAALRAALEGTA